MNRTALFTLILLLSAATAYGNTLHVGTGQQYTDVAVAVRAATPGDTVFIHNGYYLGPYWIENVHGTPDGWITILGQDQSYVVFSVGTESMHLSDVSYIRIENFTVKGQTGNGMNIDDAGTIETPSHHVILRNIRFTELDASGNNDMLKLSGLDTFEISHCYFDYGAEGGSGIDMVGCHVGLISDNGFFELGSNCIQAKGGTQHIRIERNSFRNGFQRGINLGGSTGLQFFRPLDAPFEAADIQVYSNMFKSGVTAVAYVGCTRVDVANNTIVSPTKWIFRILQETVDTTRFVPCGDNWFRNNLVWYSTAISTEVNIGPNTDPESFTLSNNMWYNATSPSSSDWTDPQLTQTSSLYGVDPQLVDSPNQSIRIPETSPAVGKGIPIPGLTTDGAGRPFATPPSIGAYEGATISSFRVLDTRVLNVYPNPFSDALHISLPETLVLPVHVQIVDVIGRVVLNTTVEESESTVQCAGLPSGAMFLRLVDNSGTSTETVTLIRH